MHLYKLDTLVTCSSMLSLFARLDNQALEPIQDEGRRNCAAHRCAIDDIG